MSKRIEVLFSANETHADQRGTIVKITRATRFGNEPSSGSVTYDEKTRHLYWSNLQSERGTHDLVDR